MQYLGIDWGTRRAAWCAVDERGELVEGMIPADEDGLARLVHTARAGCPWVCGDDERRGVGARAATGVRLGVPDRRRAEGQGDRAAGLQDRQASTRACSPSSPRRDLVPELWVPSLSDRELRERLRRRAHLVRLKTSARNRMFGLLTQWGLRGNLKTLRSPARWSGSPSGECRRYGSSPCACCWTWSMISSASSPRSRPSSRPIARDRPAGPVAGDDPRDRDAARAHDRRRDRRDLPIPQRPQADRLRRAGAHDQTIRAELLDRPDLQSRITRPCAGPRSRPPSTPGGQPTPGTGSTPDTKRRHGKANPAKSRVARKVLIACWHVLSLQQPFKRHRTSLDRDLPRQAPRRSGRLTAQKRHEKPGQLKPIICAAKRGKRTQHPTVNPDERNQPATPPLTKPRAFKEIVRAFKAGCPGGGESAGRAPPSRTTPIS